MSLDKSVWLLNLIIARRQFSSFISNVFLTNFHKFFPSQVQASAADTDAVPVPSSASLSSPGDPALPPVSWGMNFTFDVDALVAGADGNDTASAPSALLPSENALSVSLFCTAVVRLQGVIYFFLCFDLFCTGSVTLFLFSCCTSSTCHYPAVQIISRLETFVLAVCCCRCAHSPISAVTRAGLTCVVVLLLRCRLLHCHRPLSPRRLGMRRRQSRAACNCRSCGCMISQSWCERPKLLHV